MKLGLKIEITSQGAGSAAKTLNSTPALEKYASASRSFIHDAFPAREDLRQKGLDPVKSLDESSRTVTFLRFLGPQGYLICIFQARPENSGRPYDGAAAWIHIPSSVVLSGQETVKLIDEVESALSCEKGINYLLLDQIFTKDYSEQNYIPAIASIGSNGGTSAVRYYGAGTDYELNELLGKGISQQEYGKYKAIFLLRKNDAIAYTGDVINTPIHTTCLIEPPAVINGFVAYFEGGKAFAQPIEVTKGVPINIHWKKKGFADIRKSALARDADTSVSTKMFDFYDDEIYVVVYKQWFSVRCGNKSVQNFQLYIDNQICDDYVNISQNRISRPMRVRVSANGFQTYVKDVIIAANSGAIDIQLRRITYHYEFSIPVYDGKERMHNDGVIVIETNRRLNGSPIEGYTLMNEYDDIREGEGTVNRLERGGFMVSLKPFIYGFLTCIGLILAILLWNFIDNIDDVKLKFGRPPMPDKPQPYVYGTQTDEIDEDENKEDSVNLYSHEKAIAYLNSKDTWCQDSIAKYPSLSGLFEAFNEYKFDEIVNVWADSLRDVSGFSKVVTAADLAMNSTWNPRIGNHSPKYNKDNDNMISLTNFANWISADQTPKPEVAKPQPAVNHIKPDSKPQKPAAKPATPANDNNKKKKRGADGV